MHFKKTHYPSHPHNGSCEDILSSTPDSKKQFDLVASLSEWILTAGLLGFLSLFAYEFKVRSLICIDLEMFSSSHNSFKLSVLSV